MIKLLKGLVKTFAYKAKPAYLSWLGFANSVQAA
jgi:hypothetical protein